MQCTVDCSVHLSPATGILVARGDNRAERGVWSALPPDHPSSSLKTEILQSQKLFSFLPDRIVFSSLSVFYTHTASAVNEKENVKSSRKIPPLHTSERCRRVWGEGGEAAGPGPQSSHIFLNTK